MSQPVELENVTKLKVARTSNEGVTDLKGKGQEPHMKGGMNLKACG